MSNNISPETSKPIIVLHQNEPIPIAKLSTINSWIESEVEFELKSIFKKYYLTFGVKPFTIEYNPSSGMQIRADSQVGFLTGRFFDLELKSKFRKLETSKIISMAQYAENNNTLRIDSKSKVYGFFSESDTYNAIEVIGLTLLDAIDKIFNNGVATNYRDIVLISSKRAGNLAIEDWVQRGLVPPPSQNDVESTLDIFPNRLIVTALDLLMQHTKNAKIKVLCRQSIDQFVGVEVICDLKALQDAELYNFTIPRHEYYTAMHVSLSIIEERALAFGNGSTPIPSIVVDMNKTFEEFCTFFIKKLLSQEFFEVSSQHEARHPFTPELSGYIKPDIVIRHRVTNKSIILDLKNKFSAERADKKSPSISNPDIFQIVYYVLSIGAAACLLVYPEEKQSNSYPIKASESEVNYQSKVSEYLKTKANKLVFETEDVSIPMYLYRIDLSGTMKNTVRSLASLCLLIERILEND